MVIVLSVEDFKTENIFIKDNSKVIFISDNLNIIVSVHSNKKVIKYNKDD